MKWLPWLIFILFGYYLVGNNFSSKLGVIDDHEIAMFLGSDSRVKPTEITSVIMSTEVGKWGDYLRYRPSYYTLRVIETALWRDNAMLWYLARYVMLVLSLFLGWRILSLFVPQIVSYLFVFYVMTMPFWSDLLTRLGPSEIYAMPAILLFVYGIIRNKLWMITLGYVICVGAKENFLFLFPIILGWTGYMIYIKQITKKQIVSILVMTIFTLFIAGSIVVATTNTGADIYGSQISYTDRLLKIYRYKRYIVESRHLQIPLLVLFAGIIKWIVSKYIYKVSDLSQSRLAGLLISGMIIGVAIFSQYLFYDSQIPSYTRYDFPVMILFAVFQLVTLGILISLLPNRILYLRTTIIVFGVTVLLLSTLIIRKGYSHIQQKAIASASANHVFDAKMIETYKKIAGNKDSVIVFVSNKYFSFEPIISLARFLTSKGIENVMVLSYTPEVGDIDSLGKDLENRFISSMNGVNTGDASFERFSPISKLNDNCYSITFGDAKPLPSCQQIANF